MTRVSTRTVAQVEITMRGQSETIHACLCNRFKNDADGYPVVMDCCVLPGTYQAAIVGLIRQSFPSTDFWPHVAAGSLVEREGGLADHECSSDNISCNDKTLAGHTLTPSRHPAISDKCKAAIYRPPGFDNPAQSSRSKKTPASARPARTLDYYV